MRILVLACIFLFNSAMAYCQDESPTQGERGLNIKNSDLKKLSSYYNSLGKRIHKTSEKYLQYWQREQNTLLNKLPQGDTITDNQPHRALENYNGLIQHLNNHDVSSNLSNAREYIPGLDSLTATVDFLLKNGSMARDISPNNLKELQRLSSQLSSVSSEMSKANEIKHVVSDNRKLLTAQLNKLGRVKDLQRINKHAYYYQQQIAEYKSLLNNKQKLKEKIYSTLVSIPAFQDFLKNNTAIAALFRLPGNYGSPQTLAGLQTRSQVQEVIDRQMASFTATGTTQNSKQYLQQQTQQAQAQLNQLKSKIKSLQPVSGDDIIPDFKPNHQKTKTFFQRIEYGVNAQPQKGSGLLPAMANLGASIGYKFSDTKSVGVGASYKIGLGNGLNHLALSSQGLGLKSYVDMKAKGSIWLSGGFEYNYLQAFRKIPDLKSNTWQKSVLIGLMKKLRLAKTNEEIQLLFDALYKQNRPQSQPIIFRMGYKF